MSNELWDNNTGYQEINTKNTYDKFNLIEKSLNEIIHGSYNRSDRAGKQKSYRIRSHMQFLLMSEEEKKKEYQNAKEGRRFRKEEWLCKLCCGKTFEAVGQVLDYQIPLKSNLADCGGMGKADLLSRKEETAYLLEVKAPESAESPLRAVMEIYTYWQQLGGTNSLRFLENSFAKGAKTLKKGIVIFEKQENDSEKYLFKKLKKGADRYFALMEALDVECFIAEFKKGENACQEIAEIRKWRL